QQHLRTFERVLQSYHPREPLSRFLTGYYKENRQMGSTDRRMAGRLLYHYFRLGKALPHLPVSKRLAAAELLCAQDEHFLNVLEPSWVPYLTNSLAEKVSFLEDKFQFDLKDV